MRRGPSIHKIYNFPDYDAKNKWEEIICSETPFLEMARLKKNYSDKYRNLMLNCNYREGHVV